jgi:hypothetical protein
VPAAFDAGPVVSPPPDSTTVTSKTCQPPSGYPRTGGGADGTGGTTGTFAPSADAGAGKGPTPPPPIPMTDGGVGTGPSVPPSQGVPEASGDGGVGKGTTPSTPPAPTANGGGTTSTAAGSTPASTGGGGCAVVSGGVRGQAALFLGLLAALALLARKRT